MNQLEFDKRVESLNLNSYERMDLKHAMEKISSSRAIQVFDRHGRGTYVHTMTELIETYEKGFRA